jgi:putative nucleotidyltransferase with HDIG domain
MPQKLTRADIGRIFPELAQIADRDLRDMVADIWVEVAAEMGWDDLETAPNGIKNALDRTLVGHVRGVTQMAISICEIAKELHGKTYDRDLLVAACLLHDASKPVEYEPDPNKPHEAGKLRRGRASEVGRNVQHAVYAAHKAMEKKLPLKLINLIITHTHSSNVRTATWEAAALFYADYADTDAGLDLAGAPIISPRWTMAHA